MKEISSSRRRRSSRVAHIDSRRCAPSSLTVDNIVNPVDCRRPEIGSFVVSHKTPGLYASLMHCSFNDDVSNRDNHIIRLPKRFCTRLEGNRSPKRSDVQFLGTLVSEPIERNYAEENQSVLRQHFAPQYCKYVPRSNEINVSHIFTAPIAGRVL